MLVDEIQETQEIDEEFRLILSSLNLKWFEIANEVEQSGLNAYAELMRPVIEFQCFIRNSL